MDHCCGLLHCVRKDGIVMGNDRGLSGSGVNKMQRSAWEEALENA